MSLRSSSLVIGCAVVFGTGYFKYHGFGFKSAADPDVVRGFDILLMMVSREYIRKIDSHGWAAMFIRSAEGRMESKCVAGCFIYIIGKRPHVSYDYPTGIQSKNLDPAPKG